MLNYDRPIARIVRNDGPDGYIAEDGTIMPVSEKFTSRVVSCKWKLCGSASETK